MELSKSVWKVRKGDTVEVIAGREKGKTGKITRVLRDKNRVFVEKLNMVKRHTKPTQANPSGGVLEKEGSLHLSNVLVICPKCDCGVRVGFVIKGDKKTRVCKKCSTAIN